MSNVTRFASATDLATYASGVGTVPTSETDAIVVLDTDVLASSTASVGGNTQATLCMDFTKGSLTNVAIKFYGSWKANPGSGDWFIETEETSASGVLTLNSVSIVLTDTTTKKMWHFPIGALRAYKITVTGSGTATSSELNLYLGLRSN